MFNKDYLKSWRKRNGFTQGEIAKVTGMSDSYISLVESGVTMPTIEMLEKLNGIAEFSIAKAMGFQFENKIQELEKEIMRMKIEHEVLKIQLERLTISKNELEMELCLEYVKRNSEKEKQKDAERIEEDKKSGVVEQISFSDFSDFPYVELNERKEGKE